MGISLSANFISLTEIGVAIFVFLWSLGLLRQSAAFRRFSLYRKTQAINFVDLCHEENRFCISSTSFWSSFRDVPPALASFLTSGSSSEILSRVSVHFGQYSSVFMKNSSPSNHLQLPRSASAANPRDASSAGFCLDWLYLH